MRKRVFFAFQIEAPWPKQLPQGRLLDERSRHLTIAFIGAVEYAPFAEALSSFPPPPFQAGLTGYFDKIKFLPPRRANVASWHVQWHDEAGQLGQYQRQIAEWLERQHIRLKGEAGNLLPHVTLCRRPFSFLAWRQAFQPLPMAITALHLYESVGNLKYEPLWSSPILPPFEITKNGAATQYRLYASSPQQLWANAYTGLAFEYPEVIRRHPFSQEMLSLSEIIEKLQSYSGKQWMVCGDLLPFKEGVISWEIACA